MAHDGAPSRPPVGIMIPTVDPEPEPIAATRIGLIGDVHTEADLLDRALHLFAELRADVVLCVGDLATGPGDLERCCSLLQQHRVPTVRGNHDRWLLADLAQDPDDPEVRRRVPSAVLTHLSALRRRTSPAVVKFLRELPPVRWFRTSRGLMLLCHGVGSNDLAGITPEHTAEELAADPDVRGLLAYPDLRLVLNGHTHRRMVRRVGDLTVINAGTLEENQQPGVVLLDLDDCRVSWLPLGPDGSSTTVPLGSIEPSTA